MGNVYMTGGGDGGGGGLTSEDVTAKKSEVLAGKTALTSDSGDEAVTGTMVNQGAKTATLNAGGSYTIPEGYHNGQGKVSANSLASQTSGDAAASDIAAGKTAWVNGAKVTGSLAELGQWQMTGGTVIAGSGDSAYLALNNIPEGIYRKNGAYWAPEVRTTLPNLRAAIGYTDPSKVWNGVTIAGLKGTMSVSSVVSFSCASVSGVNAVLKWKNPAKGPYGGVIIRYKEGGYPSSVSDGTQIYKGVGSNSALSGDSGVTVKFPKGGTTYYCRLWMYCDTSNGTMYSGSKDCTVQTQVIKGSQIFTSSGTFTAPDGVTAVQVFCVGGGSSGCCNRSNSGGGGGGGYTTTKTVSVTPGNKYAVVVGAGGAETGTEQGAQNAGGQSSFGGGLVAANGGGTTGWKAGAPGGSGGGATQGGKGGKDGGSNGSDGESVGNDLPGGKGQGSTTRAFAETGGTLYSGGGGGGEGGAGGTGGGAEGGWSNNRSGYQASANTGGGGGGAMWDSKPYAATGGAGGSGIVIVRWGY